MKKKLLIFDADGTLWDSEMDTYQAFNHTLKENVGFEIGKKQFQTLAGLSMETMFEKVLPEDKRYLAEEFTKKYRQYYIEECHYLDTTVLFENVKSTIEIFKSKGFHMAIASGKVKKVLDKMVDYFDLQDFDFVLGTARTNFKSKPDPGVVNYIMNELNISKDDTVMIGDSKSDILCGKNAGISTIAVTYGFDTVENLLEANPDYSIDNFIDLLEILEIR